MPLLWEPNVEHADRCSFAAQADMAALAAAAQAVVMWRTAAAARAEAAGWPAAVAGPQTALLLDAGLSLVLRPSKLEVSSKVTICP